jgi:hypothetical protein
VLSVDLVGSSRIWPAQVGWAVGRVGSDGSSRIVRMISISTGPTAGGSGGESAAIRLWTLGPRHGRCEAWSHFDCKVSPSGT